MNTDNTTTDTENRDNPTVWILDSENEALESARGLLAEWASPLYYPFPTKPDDSAVLPDAILFSAELRGGAAGDQFLQLRSLAENVPLIAVSRLRSLTQAVAYFRAGATDYLSFPLDEQELRERIAAAIEIAASRQMSGVMVELEAVDPDPGEIHLRLTPSVSDEEPSQEHPDTGSLLDIPAVPVDAAPLNVAADDEDILAQLHSEIAGPDLDSVSARVDPDTPAESGSATTDSLPDGEEPEVVDGLPIPTLWEELPCGLLVYDSVGNLVFSNQLGLELFGAASLAELQDVLEHRRGDFHAYAANQKPLPEDHWPQDLAWKTGTPRSAVLSVETTSRRRSWLRLDCLPHLNDGAITRLTMTVVNMTGELPPLTLMSPPAPASREPAQTGKKSRAKRRGKNRR